MGGFMDGVCWDGRFVVYFWVVVWTVRGRRLPNTDGALVECGGYGYSTPSMRTVCKHVSGHRIMAFQGSVVWGNLTCTVFV